MLVYRYQTHRTQYESYNERAVRERERERESEREICSTKKGREGEAQYIESEREKRSTKREQERETQYKKRDRERNAVQSKFS